MSSLMLVFAVACSVTSGDLPIDPHHRIEPIVTRDAYMDCCRTLGVSKDQLMIAEMLYEDYLTGLVELQSSSNERAKAAGADILDAALQGHSTVTRAQRHELQVAVEQTRKANWSSVDALQATLIEGTIAIGVATDKEETEAAVSDLRRRVTLEHARRSTSRRDYAGEGLDLAMLVESERNGVLQGAPSESLNAVLDTWRNRAGAVVLQNGPIERTAASERRIADIGRDIEQSRKLMAERAARWRQLHELNTWAANSIAGLLAPGENAEAWLTCVRVEQFPWLHASDHAEQLAAWVKANGNAGQQEKAGLLLSTYQRERDAVRQDAESLLLSARIDHAVVLGSPAAEVVPDAQEIHLQWLRFSGELELLKARTIERIEAMLTPGQEAAARRSLRD